MICMEGAVWRGTGWNKLLNLSLGAFLPGLAGLLSGFLLYGTRVWLLEPWVQDLALLHPVWVCSWA